VRQRLLEARRKEGGFTLIELLIVIVILGILAAIVVIAVGAFNDRGQKAACKSDVKAVEVAVEAYRAKTSNYPTDLGALVPDYLRELPPTQNIDGPTGLPAGGTGRDYYITYWPTGGTTGFIGSPSRSAGAVTGDLHGNAVTGDCSA
jgi:type II secretion system protein G